MDDEAHSESTEQVLRTVHGRRRLQLHTPSEKSARLRMSHVLYFAPFSSPLFRLLEKYHNRHSYKLSYSEATIRTSRCP